MTTPVFHEESLPLEVDRGLTGRERGEEAASSVTTGTFGR
jgi:hypothetical protein